MRSPAHPRIAASLPLPQEGPVALMLQCLRATDQKGLSCIPDWQALLGAAGYHGLLPSLTTALRGIDWCGVPPDTRARLERWHKRHLGLSMVQLAALRSIAGVFVQNSVLAVCWKGPTLAIQLYGSVAARESGDLDFLVAPRHLDRAAALLQSLGFTRHRKTRTERGDRRVAATERDLGFVRSHDAVYVELHTETMPARFAAWQQGDTFSERSVPLQLSQEVCVPVLQPEDLLLSLIGHGIKHHWERLKWVEDTARFLARHHQQLDWELLLAATRREGKSRALVHGVSLAELLLGAPLPLAICNSPEFDTTSAITRTIAQALLSGDRQPQESVTSALMGLLVPSTLGRWRFAVSRAFEPQLRDFNDTFSRSALLCKWRRMLQQAGARGVVSRAAISLRRAR